MSKIIIKLNLIKDNENILSTTCNGIINENKIKYEDENTLNILDTKTNILTRKNNEYEIKLDFTNQEGIYIYNQLQIPITLNVYKLENNKNKYYVKYKLTMSNEVIGNFTYELNYEVKI